MNFLAHAYLSGENEKILVGNFIGDFVKGKQFDDYDKDVKNGILLHREIDRYTDTHPIVHHSKSILTEKYRHYSGVIVDIFYDHILARHWSDYHKSSLLTYTENVYSILRSYKKILPSGVIHMLNYMIPDNWLFHYASLKGIRRALYGMSRRTKFESGMDKAIEDLEDHYEEFREDFKGFFPELISFVHSVNSQ